MHSIAQPPSPGRASTYCTRWTDMWNRLLPATDVLNLPMPKGRGF